MFYHTKIYWSGIQDFLGFRAGKALSTAVTELLKPGLKVSLSHLIAVDLRQNVSQTFLQQMGLLGNNKEL